MWISISRGAGQIRASRGISTAIGTVIPKFKRCSTYRLKQLWVFRSHSNVIGVPKALKNKEQNKFEPSTDGEPVRKTDLG